MFFERQDELQRKARSTVDQSRAKKGSSQLQTRDKRPRQNAREEQEDTRRGRPTEPTRLHPQRTPASRRLTQGQAREEPGSAPNATWRRLQGERAVTDKVTCQTEGRDCEYLGRDASSKSSEPVPCGKRCRRCSIRKEKRRTQSAGE